MRHSSLAQSLLLSMLLLFIVISFFRVYLGYFLTRSVNAIYEESALFELEMNLVMRACVMKDMRCDEPMWSAHVFVG